MSPLSKSWLSDHADKLATRVEELEAERETWAARIEDLTARLESAENRAGALTAARQVMQEDRDILYKGIHGIVDMDATPGWLKPMLMGIIRQTAAWRHDDGEN